MLVPIQFHLLSFEGPDAYARAGGIATRVSGLAQALAEADFDTHLWFIGDPALPGHETQESLHLHRWCQWISRYHPAGVYDGEEGKRLDYAGSLPPFLLREMLWSRLQQGGRAVILAEEWHTVDAVLHLDWLLRLAGMRDQVTLFWNANNTFGFDRLDWGRLAAAATITTVSRYMKQLMRPLGVSPLVISQWACRRNAATAPPAGGGGVPCPGTWAHGRGQGRTLGPRQALALGRGHAGSHEKTGLAAFTHRARRN